MMLEVAVQVLSVRDVFVPGTGCVLERVAAGELHCVLWCVLIFGRFDDFRCTCIALCMRVFGLDCLRHRPSAAMQYCIAGVCIFLLAGLIQVAPLCGDLILLTMQGVVSTCIRVCSVSALGGYVCDSWDGCSW